MSTWQELLNNSIRDIEKLKEVLQLTNEEAEQMTRIAQKYPVCVNPYYFSVSACRGSSEPVSGAASGWN